MKENFFNTAPHDTSKNLPNWAGLRRTERLSGEVVGSRTIRRLTSAGPDSSLALTDARAIKNLEKAIVGIGFQKAYLGLLPAAVDARMVWVGQEITNEREREQVQTAFEIKLKESEGRHKAVLVTGGEHLHPDTMGSHGEEVDEGRAEHHGGYDIERDFVTMGLIRHADENDLALIAVCRGMQGALSYYSKNVAEKDRIFPRDHNQKAHTFRDEDLEGKVFNRHEVKNILYGDIVDEKHPKKSHNYEGYQGKPINIEIPEVRKVNSVHEQGYRRCDISKEAMAELNRNGIYPWLISNVKDVTYEEQVYEGWLLIKNTADGKAGKVTGVLTQFHPEQQAFDEDLPDMMRLRLFMQDVVTNHHPKKDVYTLAA